MHQVIARKWRPQSFQDLIGQTSVSRTLLNAFELKKIPHSLLLTGPRGTGKTSTARIVAKTLRCEHVKNFKPCGKCSECLEIAAGQSVHVIEIDGASNNGVDAIRDLKDSVNYRPSHGFYKIYIIDEVHMLSISAFNALLKTLEEPPEHVIFILATTEMHKIPATILSRCQKFHFQRVPSALLVQRLEKICQKEGVQAEEEALWLMAYEGEGSVRDSESLLEQAITFSQGQLTTKALSEILGLTSRQTLLALVRAFLNQDSKTVLKAMEALRTSPQEPKRWLHSILKTLRDLLYVKLWGESSLLVEASQVELKSLKSLSEKVEASKIHQLFELFLEGEKTLRTTQSAFVALEMLFLKACLPEKKSPSPHPSQDLTPYKDKDNGSKENSHKDSLKKDPSKSPPRPSFSSKAPSFQAPQTPSSPLTSKNSSHPQWERLVHKLKKLNPPMAAKLESFVFVPKDKKTVTLTVPTSMKFLYETVTKEDFKAKLINYMNTFWGPGFSVEFCLGENNTALSLKETHALKEKQKKKKERQEVEEHEMIKMTKDIFKGKIESIKEESQS